MGGTGLMEHPWYVYGPLEGRTARGTVQVENGGKAVVEFGGLT
jgi:hypothetical protein